MSGPGVAFVTGAASGIGRSLADALIARGDRVIAADLAADAIAAHAGAAGWPDGAWEAISLDVRDAAAWDEAIPRAAERWGGLDLVMNIAGVLRPGWVHECEAAHVDLQIDVNLKGVIHGTRAASRVMIAQGRGHIVNMGSMAAIAPVPGLALYAASKFAVRGWSLAVAQELRPRGIYVTCVCPDAVATPMLTLQEDYEEAAMTFSGSARPLAPEDVVHAIMTRGLRKRPLELLIPPSRGWLAKLANTFPDLAFKIGPGLIKKGRAAQRKARAARGGGGS